MTTSDSDQPQDPQRKGILSVLGTGLGCLFLLLGAVVLAVVALAYFFNEPALGVAVIALVVALAALKSRGRRP